MAPEIWPDWGSEEMTNTSAQEDCGRGSVFGNTRCSSVGAGTCSPLTSPDAFSLANYTETSDSPCRAFSLPCQQREVATSPEAGIVWRDFLGPESGAM